MRHRRTWPPKGINLPFWCHRNWLTSVQLGHWVTLPLALSVWRRLWWMAEVWLVWCRCSGAMWA
jgi:hypothetical protein